MEEVVAAPGTVRHELVPQLRFPPGFRFVPKEAELVDVYLRAKIEGRKPPLDVVNDVNILDWQPGKLVEAYKGYGENKWYFFTVREQSSSNKENEPSRKVRGVPGVTATWKATGSLQVIRRARSEVIVGNKRVLIYNSTDPDENGKWSMHKFTLQDHDEIGQYALYSIQRKQHSDTEDKAGDDDNDMGSEKKTKKRKRTEKPCSTELEGVVQLPHTETLAEPPLKPARKAKVQRKKKPSMQVEVVGEQQQQGQSSPMGPVTPPNKEELAPRQQEAGQQQPSAADGAPVAVAGLSAVPLQALHVFPPLEPAGMLGAPAPMIEEGFYLLDDLSSCELSALQNSPHPDDPAMLFNNQGHQEQCLPGLTGTTTEEFLVASDTNVVNDHAPFQIQLQPYQQQEDDYSLFGGGEQNQQHLFLGENQGVYMEEQGWQHPDLFLSSNNTTQTQPMNNSSGGGWEYGDDQLHQIHQLQQLQEENSGVAAFGVVQDQQPAMNHHHPQGISHGLLPPVDQQSSGSDGFQMYIGTYFKSMLAPQDMVAAGTQEGGGGDDPATLQLQAGTQEQWDCNLHLQHALEEHVEDGQCSCMICAYLLGP